MGCRDGSSFLCYIINIIVDRCGIVDLQWAVVVFFFRWWWCGGGIELWCFLLRVVACAAEAVHVEAMSSDGIGIKGISVVDVVLADGTVWSSGGPDVNQMG